MLDSQDTPTFNMKVVVRETGLKPDTLRAWERRYGIPNPNRTAGGHRLYSQHQINLLKWLIVRQEEGMTISHAVDLWQQLLEKGEDPFGIDSEDMPVLPIESDLSGDMLIELREAWLKSCFSFDEYQAQQSLSQAFAQFPVETVCTELLQKNLSRIGQLWYEGEVTVQQEHFASALAVRQLEALLAASARPTQDICLIVACAPHEQHTFSPLLLTLLFRRRGWNVIYLGADVPYVKLETAVQAVDPHLVIISAQTLHTASLMMPMAKLLNEMKIPLAFGGAVFSYLENAQKLIPGYYLGNDLRKVPEIVYQLIKKQ